MGKLIIMIRSLITTTHTTLSHKAAVLLCMITLASILPTNAAPPTNPSPPAKTTPPASPAPASPTAKPSRYIAPEELQSYVQTVSLTFSIKNRRTDPFGQQQNPDAKPPPRINTIRPTGPKNLPSPVTPFAEIVRSIRVTTVMPADRRFLVGDRAFKQGDRFPMKFRSGRSINVEIATVSSQEITFRNIDNGEIASLKISLMPPGMTQGNGKISAPGMVSGTANSPLEIEPTSSTGGNSLN